MADNIELKNNLRSFRETVKDYADYYTVIGGTACMMLMEEAGRSFRATKDVDMILIMEDGGEEFCKAFGIDARYVKTKTQEISDWLNPKVKKFRIKARCK